MQKKKSELISLYFADFKGTLTEPTTSFFGLQEIEEFLLIDFSSF